MADIPGNTSSTATFEGDPLFGASYSGDFEIGFDVDWVSINLVAGATYYFNTSAVTATGAIESGLFSSVGAGLAVDVTGAGVGPNSFFQYTAAVSGLHFFAVFEQDNLLGQYTVNVSRAAPIVELTTGPDTYGGMTIGARILGGAGDDNITLGLASDALGDQGNDTLTGNAADNVIFGGNGDDSIEGGAGLNWLFGDEGADRVNGGADADRMFGGLGSDTIKAAAGDDSVTGGSGDDDIDGGAGIADVAVFSGARQDYTITKVGSVYTVLDTVADRDGTDTVYKVETLRFSDGDYAVVNAAPTISVEGNLDIVVANVSTEKFGFLRGNGSGAFAPIVQTSVGSGPTTVRLGDLNGDGALDVVVANTDPGGNIMVSLGSGTGTFATATVVASVVIDEFVLADVNGDGKLDIIASGKSSDMVVFLGDGLGGFAPPTSFDFPRIPTSVAVGDVNGDGKLDVVTSSLGVAVDVFLGSGTGSFAPPVPAATGAGVNPVHVTLGDVDNDGDLDIVTANRDSDNVSVLLGDGTGGFAPQTLFATGVEPSRVALGDIDGDGDLDLMAVALRSNAVSILLGDGSGGYGAATDFPVGSVPIAAEFADVNKDGKLDIVVINGGSFTVGVLLGNGIGGFGPQTAFPGGAFPYSLSLGDVDSARQTNEDTAIVFDAAHNNAITLSDTDAGSADETLTLTVGHGRLTIATNAGLTSVVGDGTATVTLTGSIAELNAAIDGLVYQPALDYIGKDKLTVTLDDPGLKSLDGAKSATSSVPIIIKTLNDAPTIAAPPSIAGPEDQVLAITGLVFGDVDAGSASVVVSLAVPAGQGTLAATSGSGVTVGGSGSNAVTLTGALTNINAFIAASMLSYAPVAGASGNVVLDIGIADQGASGTGGALTASGQTTLAIAAVNDAPGLSVTQTVASLAETADTSSARKVADIAVFDPDGGSNGLALGGADAGLFELQGTALFLKAGVALDTETNPKLDVTVILDDPGAGGTPDGSVNLSIDITDVAETIAGNKRANVLVGTAVSELIDGRAGNDTIRGNGGNDTIIGGKGADVMTGNGGKDVFKFLPGDLPNLGAVDKAFGLFFGKYDVITDFKRGSDKIDLSALDANTHRDGNQAFHFEGRDKLSSSRGELVYRFGEDGDGDRATVVVGDTNGDGSADFRIVLKGYVSLHASDFIL